MANNATFLVLLFFAGWYCFGSIANIYCKQFLKLYPNPFVLTLGQYCMGVMLSSLFLSLSSLSKVSKDPYNEPKKSESFFTSLPGRGQSQLLIICLVNGIGHLMTNYSMNSVAVSFTHTVKAAEPLFSVFLTVTILKQKASFAMYFSLLPIILGVLLATTTEISYTHFGMITAMSSNLLFSTRNIFTKKLQNQSQMQSMELFWWLSVVGMIMVVIFMFFTSPEITGMVLEPVGSAWKPLLIASFSHAIYNLLSFMILSHVSPITHAVGNAMRRLVIIYCSILWFHSPVGLLNILGTFMACIGVLCYSRASQEHNKNKNKKSYKNNQFLNL